MSTTIATLGMICYALANGGTLCLEKAESGDFKIACISPKDLGQWSGVKSCEFTTTSSTTTIVPSR